MTTLNAQYIKRKIYANDDFLHLLGQIGLYLSIHNDHNITLIKVFKSKLIK